MIRPSRGLIREALTESGWTVASTIVDDGGGGGTAVSIAGGTIACRIDPLAGGENVVADRISDRSTHLITLPPETAVTTEMQFSIEGRGTYEVTAVREHTGELSTVVEAVERS